MHDQSEEILPTNLESAFFTLSKESLDTLVAQSNELLVLYSSDSMYAAQSTKHGIPSLWPQFTYTNDNECSSKSIACYCHNGRLWPFVMGYWGMAAARHGQVDVFAEEMQNLVWLSQRNHTFAEFYELDGTFPQERRRQLIVERRWFAGSSVSRTVWTHVSSRQSRVSPYQT